MKLWNLSKVPWFPSDRDGIEFPPSPGGPPDVSTLTEKKKKAARTTDDKVSLPADKCLPVLPEAFCQILGTHVYKSGSQLLYALTSPEEGELYNWQGLECLCVSLSSHIKTGLPGA